MDEVKAFVGHSFSPADEQVVRPFLDFFDGLSKSPYHSFSWDHAEEAEPFSISGKVLKKFEDKNVFIGICTSREAACSKMWPVWNGKVKARSTDVEYKTSDWIIQEVGLAIGRGMKVIILLEEGVRRAGGLQGDSEYIEFPRDYPHKCFGKLSQMLNAISPKELPAVAMASAPETKIEEKEEALEILPFEKIEAKPEWTQEDYRSAVFRPFFRADKTDFNNLDAAYRKKFPDPADILIWDAQLEYLRVLLGRENADFEKLKEFEKKGPNSADIKFYIGMGYDGYGEHALAAKYCEAAAALFDKKSEQIRMLGHAAVQRWKAESGDRGAELIERGYEGLWLTTLRWLTTP